MNIAQELEEGLESELTELGGQTFGRRGGGDPRWIKAKYAGTSKDGTAYKKGDEVLYFPATKTIMVGKEADAAWKKFKSEAGDDSGNPYFEDRIEEASAPDIKKFSKYQDAVLALPWKESMVLPEEGDEVVVSKDFAVGLLKLAKEGEADLPAPGKVVRMPDVGMEFYTANKDNPSRKRYHDRFVVKLGTTKGSTNKDKFVVSREALGKRTVVEDVEIGSSYYGMTEGSMSSDQVLAKAKKDGIKGKLIRKFPGGQELRSYEIDGHEWKIRALPSEHVTEDIEPIFGSQKLAPDGSAATMMVNRMMSGLSTVNKHSYLDISSDARFGSTSVFVKWANVPPSSTRLDVLNAKRQVTISIGGWDKDGGGSKVTAKAISTYGVKFRAKTGTPDQIADYVIDFVRKSSSTTEWAGHEDGDLSVLHEAQTAAPSMAFDDDETKPGAFKVSTKAISMLKGQGLKPDQALFRVQRQLVMDLAWDDLTKLFGVDSMDKAQDMLAGNARKAFNKWLSMLSKVSPKLGKIVRQQPENAALLFYVTVSRVSGQDMADIILKRYFETETDHAGAVKARLKVEALQEEIENKDVIVEAAKLSMVSSNGVISAEVLAKAAQTAADNLISVRAANRPFAQGMEDALARYMAGHGPLANVDDDLVARVKKRWKDIEKLDNLLGQNFNDLMAIVAALQSAK